MASVGRLSVVLEAKTGKFAQKMRTAEKALGRLVTKVKRLESFSRNLDKALGNTSKSVEKMGQRAAAASQKTQMLGKGLQATARGAKGLSKASEPAAAKVSMVGKKALNTSKQMNQLAISMTVASIQLGVMGQAAGAISRSIIGAGAAVSKTAMEIQFGLTEAASVAGGTAGAFDNAFSRFEASATRLAGTTQFTTTQVIGGLKFLAAAGLGVEKSLGAIPQVLRLASAANVEVAKSADIVTNAMTGFGESVKRLPAVTNALVATVTNSNVNLLQLGEAFKKTSNVSRSFNVSLEDTTTLLGLLGDSGIQGAEAGTGLKRAFSALANPSKKARDILKGFGVSVKDISAKNGGAGVLIAKLAGVREGFVNAGREAEFSARLFELFGQRAAPKVLALVKEGEKGIEAFAKLRATITVLQREDIAKFLQEKKLATAQGQVDLLASAFEGLKDAIGKVINDAVVPIIANITRVINAIKGLDEETLGYVIAAAKWTAALTGLTFALFTVAGSVLFFSSAIVGARLASFALTGATGNLAKAILVLKGASGVGIAAIAGLAVGMAILELQSDKAGGSIDIASQALADFLERAKEIGILETIGEAILLIFTNVIKMIVDLIEFVAELGGLLGDFETFDTIDKIISGIEDVALGLDLEMEAKVNVAVDLASLRKMKRNIEEDLEKLVPGGIKALNENRVQAVGGLSGGDLNAVIQLVAALKDVNRKIEKLAPSPKAGPEEKPDLAKIAIDKETKKLLDELLKFKDVKAPPELAEDSGAGRLSAILSEAKDLQFVMDAGDDFKDAANAALNFGGKIDEVAKGMAELKVAPTMEHLKESEEAISSFSKAAIDAASSSLSGAQSLQELDERAQKIAKILVSKGIPATKQQVLETDRATEAAKKFASALKDAELEVDEIRLGDNAIFDPFAAAKSLKDGAKAAFMSGDLLSADVLSIGAEAGAAGFGIPPGVASAGVSNINNLFSKIADSIPNETLSSAAQILVPAFMMATGAIGSMVTVIGSAIGPLLLLVAGFLAFGGIIGAFFALFAKTEAFERFQLELQEAADVLIKAVEPAAEAFFSSLVPVVDAVTRSLAAFFQSFSAVAGGGLGDAIFFVIKGLGFLILSVLLVAGLFGDVLITAVQLLVLGLGVLVAIASALAIAWDTVLIAIAEFVNTLADDMVIDPTEAIARRAENMRNLEGLDEFNEELEKLKVTDEVLDQFKALFNATQHLTEAKDEEAEAVNKLTESLVNVPQGVKVALARFRASDTVDPSDIAGDVGALPAIHPGQGSSSSINIQNVFFEDPMDLDQAKEEIMRIADRENSMSTGSPGGQEFNDGNGG